MNPFALLTILLMYAINVYEALILLYVLLSWFVTDRYSPIYRIYGPLDRIVSPVLYPIRQALRPYMRGMPFDLSPIIVIVLLGLLKQVIITILAVPFAPHVGP